MYKAVFIKPFDKPRWQHTCSEAVCHAGQHTDKSKYNVYIAPRQDTQSDQTWITSANYTMPAFCFASVHQMAPPLSEVEDI